VPGSIADEAALSARKISGTPNGYTTELLHDLR